MDLLSSEDTGFFQLFLETATKQLLNWALEIEGLNIIFFWIFLKTVLLKYSENTKNWAHLIWQVWVFYFIYFQWFFNLTLKTDTQFSNWETLSLEQLGNVNLLL